ncbi:hypothetical protein [Streptomyces sp. MBT28]|uniref:hypothetical protein n=1 Tax=Streptomyces sp. MBT28 TaxID=1488357 RepID=UPI000619B042|nr:hypothetical protein [Streptomyces sp. MBT28]
MTDQTTPLRDRIARAIYGAHSHIDVWDQADARTRAVVYAEADAVLAVLPAPADQAAVLGEAADHAEIVALRLRLKHDYGAANGAFEVMAELRRMADETATTETRVAHWRPVSLATPCLNCGHPYNWHTGRGACAAQEDACGCRSFDPGQRPEPLDPRSILGADPEFSAGARQDGAQPS